MERNERIENGRCSCAEGRKRYDFVSVRPSELDTCVHHPFGHPAAHSSLLDYDLMDGLYFSMSGIDEGVCGQSVAIQTTF